MFAPVKLLGVDKGTLNHACMEVLVLHNFVYVCRGFEKNSNVSAGFKKFYNMVFPLLPLTMKFVDKRYYTYIFYHCLLTGNIFGNLTGF